MPSYYWPHRFVNNVSCPANIEYSIESCRAMYINSAIFVNYL
jgi:hypothetical protein